MGGPFWAIHHGRHAWPLQNCLVAAHAQQVDTMRVRHKSQDQGTPGFGLAWKAAQKLVTCGPGGGTCH